MGGNELKQSQRRNLGQSGRLQMVDAVDSDQKTGSHLI